ncbi:MAG: hypothetical protein ABIH25_05690 [Candidatus Woesearchaeota archaeon]
MTDVKINDQREAIKKLLSIRSATKTDSIRGRGGEGRPSKGYSEVARQSMTIHDQREAIKKLMRSDTQFQGGRGKKGGFREVARRIGCSEGWIRQVLMLEKAPKEIQKAIERKEIPLTTGMEITKAPKEMQKELLQTSYNYEVSKGCR